MEENQNSISLFGHPLFSVIYLKTPSKKNLYLPSDACITYIIEDNNQPLTEDIIAKKDNIILSLCGLTLGKMLMEQPKGHLLAILVHFNHQILSQVFQGEKPELWEELNEPVTKYVVQSAASKIIKQYFKTIHTFFENKDVLSESILKAKLKEIIFLLLKSDNSEYITQIVKSLFSEREFTFKDLVDAHILETNSIEQLAMVTNCSISTFKRKFKELYNTTPAKYQLEIKLKKVAHKLLTTDNSILTIGLDCGFNSPEHLSRTFKQKYGLSPREYRLNFSVK